MSPDPHISDLRQRLEHLESRLEEKLGGMDPATRSLPHHQRSVTDIRAKTKSVRGKLARAEGPGLEDLKSELEADWENLNQTLERWIAHVDTDFEHRK